MKEEHRKILRFACGALFALLTVFTLYSLVTYLFTWNNDQSLLFQDNMLDNVVKARNGGGKLGFMWSHFLVAKLFGLGAFVIPFFFGGVSIVCFKKSDLNLVRLFFLTLMGSIVLSMLFSFVFSLFGQVAVFGEGAGGSYGHYVNEWLCAMLGNFGTGGVISFLLLIWAVLLNDRVVDKINALFDRLAPKAEPQPMIKPEVVNDVETMAAAEPQEKVFEVVDLTPEQEGADPVDETEDVTAEEEEMLQVNAVDDEDTVSDLAKEDELPPLEVIPGQEVSFDGDEEKWKERYDPRLSLSRYKFPTTSLLDDYQSQWYEVSKEELEKNKEKIVNTLKDYKISITKISARIGPTVTLYEVVPAPGVRVSQIKRLEEDIALSLAAKGVRVVTLVGTNAIGIEVANDKPSVVSMKSVLEDPKFRNSKYDLPVVIGRTISNEVFSFDLAKMPHLLVAGATGQGKSVGLNAIITSLVYKKHPAELKFVMVDPKKVELSLYSPLNDHYLAKLPDEEDAIITATDKVVYTLKSLCKLMDRRYDLLKSASVRNVKEYNEKFLSRKLNPQKGHDYMPYIVVIIDEFADLLITAGRDVEEPIARLAQLARAIGIHLVIATQRPTTNIITGSIKANFPARIAFKVMSSIDSKTILDQTGANRLIGRGDMLIMTGSSEPTRVQCAFIDTPEVERITDHISSQAGYGMAYLLPEYVPVEDGSSPAIKVSGANERDDLFKEAARLVVREQQGSTSLIQRKMNLGYNRAGRIMDQLEEAGIVGPSEGSKARQVRITSIDALEHVFSTLGL